MMCILHDWHWIIEKLHEWQDLAAGILAFLAGILGFGAAIWTVRVTLQSERRKEARELSAISRALTAEIFQFGSLALEAHNYLKEAIKHSQGLTIHEIEDAARFVNPTIYSNIGSHVGLLGDRAYEVVLFFARIQIFLNGVARMRRDITEKNRNVEKSIIGQRMIETGMAASVGLSVGKENSEELVEKLLLIAETSGSILPHLTKDTRDEVVAKNFQKAIKEARVVWKPRPVDPTS